MKISPLWILTRLASGSKIHGLLVGSTSHKIALKVCLVMGKAVENVDGEGK